MQVRELYSPKWVTVVHSQVGTGEVTRNREHTNRGDGKNKLKIKLVSACEHFH